jgi:hypothetical protein
VLWYRYDFRINMMFGSSLPPVVCMSAFVLFTVLMFVYVLWCPAHYVVVFFCFLRLVWPVHFDCPLVFCNVCLSIFRTRTSSIKNHIEMREDVGQPSRRRLTEGRCGSTKSTTFDWREGVGQPSRRRLIEERCGSTESPTFDWHWKSIGEGRFFLPTLFPNLQKRYVAWRERGSL